MTMWVVQNDHEAIMSFSVEGPGENSHDLQSDLGHADRFPRLITTLRQIRL